MKVSQIRAASRRWHDYHAGTVDTFRRLTRRHRLRGRLARAGVTVAVLVASVALLELVLGAIDHLPLN
jgi:hypothetical protein